MNYLVLLNILKIVKTVKTITDFPIADFFEITDENLQHDIKENLLCSTHANEDGKKPCCSCQDDCIQTKSCCADALWGGSKFANIDVYKKHLVSISNRQKNNKCFALSPNLTTNASFSPYKEYMMVATCHEGASEIEKDECSSSNTNVEYIVPVKDKDNLTYRNMYCAKCNFVDEFELVQLDVVHKFNSDISKLQVSSISIDGQACNQYSSQCKTGTKYYDLCHAFLGPISGFANYFCCLCNGTEKDIKIKSYCPRNELNQASGQRYSTFLTFSGLSNKFPNSSCFKRNVSDILFNHCNSLPCPEGYVVNESRCKRIRARRTKRHMGGGGLIPPGNIGAGGTKVKKIDLDRFDNCFVSTGAHYFNIIGAKNLTESKLQNIVKMLAIDLDLKYDVIYNGSFKKIIKMFGLRNRTNVDLVSFLIRLDDMILNMEITSNYYPNNYYVEAKYLFPYQRMCATIEMLDLVNITKNCQVRIDNELIKNSYLTFILVLEMNSPGVRKLFLCQRSFLYSNCIKRVLNSSLTFDDKDMIYSSNENKIEVFKPEEYVPVDITTNSYAVCQEEEISDASNPAQLPHWSEIAHQVKGFIYLVGAILSLISYVFHFIMFLILKELQYFSGLLVLILLMSLFVADGSFFAGKTINMFGFESVELCQVFGVLDHFALLITFYFGVMISINAVNTIRSNSIEQYPKKVVVIVHAVCSILISAAIIGTGFILSDYQILSFTYRNEEVCALNGYNARLFFMAIPLGFFSAVSFTLLLVSVLHIVKESRNEGEISGEENSRKLYIVKTAVKVVVLAGLPEIIGLIDLHGFAQNTEKELIGEVVSSFLFSLMKGFRGVILFFAYSLERLVLSRRRRNDAIKVTQTTSHANGTEKEEEVAVEVDETSIGTV